MLTSPTPHGPDGELESDVDLEEKVLRCVDIKSIYSNFFAADSFYIYLLGIGDG
jgi:hypothetical protein